LIATIASALNESAITRKELTEHLGVSVEALTNWRYGRDTPTLQHIVAALEYLGFHVAPVRVTDRPDPTEGYYPISIEWLNLLKAREKQQQ